MEVLRAAGVVLAGWAEQHCWGWLVVGNSGVDRCWGRADYLGEVGDSFRGKDWIHRRLVPVVGWGVDSLVEDWGFRTVQVAVEEVVGRFGRSSVGLTSPGSSLVDWEVADRSFLGLGDLLVEGRRLVDFRSCLQSSGDRNFVGSPPGSPAVGED